MQDASIGIVFHPNKPTSVLWVKRRDLGIWVLPGGGIDPGESPKSAAKREILEESGLEVDLIREAALFHPVNRWTATTHLFVCCAKGAEAKATEESECAMFFPISSPPCPHFPLHEKWLKEVLENHNEKIERTLTEFSWWKVALFFIQHPFIISKYLWLKILK